ncbi:MAG: DNA gyrase inhibitor YacG [Candidatus Tectomicrobia bacterium]|nr:DNA gyrase inhibitor YacG [Candidatus Tectomicrobia bacterium]
MSQDGHTVCCPTCGRRTTWRENPHRPFCSARCRLADLEGWLSGRYRVAGDPEAPDAPLSDPDLTDGQPSPG